MPGSVHRRALPLGVLALAVAGIGVTQVSGAIPNPADGRYYACFKQDGGAKRVINFPKVSSCPNGQRLIDWGRSGPQGPQGAAGAAGAEGAPGAPGAQGLQGAPGPAGITKIKVATVNNTAPAPGGVGATGNIAVQCPAGAKVVGGSFSQRFFTLTFTDSVPDGQGWRVYWRKDVADPTGDRSRRLRLRHLHDHRPWHGHRHGWQVQGRQGEGEALALPRVQQRRQHGLRDGLLALPSPGARPNCAPRSVRRSAGLLSSSA